jgi:hypothetical protein
MTSSDGGGICCVALMAGAVSATANENFLSKPPEEWTEAEALQVLNDSPWAGVVTTTVQNTQCDYEHPAFEGLFPAEIARSVDFDVTRTYGRDCEA